MLDSETYDPHTPKAIEDIVGNAEIWGRFAGEIAANTASHTVLVGPAGCGKSLFLKLALKKHHTLVVECTANTGLRDVRDTIRVFARGARNVGGGLQWIVFEHADALTSDTQAFLRRMLETTSGSTRVIFECRDAGAITEPILSRSAIVNVAAPDETEIVYEVMRRTGFAIDRSVAERICRHTYGNMRAAVLHALAAKHCGHTADLAQIDRLLAARPTTWDDLEWVKWATETEHDCRMRGIDLRDVLRLGWENNPMVAHTCATWSRLGGTSPRALFFDCVASLIHCGRS
jgi:replication factor C small subunit